MDTRHINILNVIGGNLKRAAATNGGEYAGTCPFCGGHDRFRVWPMPTVGSPRFWCRQCNRTGDVIQFIMERDGVEFKTALERLGLGASPSYSVTYQRPRSASSPRVWKENAQAIGLQDTAWQQAAAEFCRISTDQLWSADGQPARNYLYERGLTDGVIEAAQLGYNPHTQTQYWGSVAVWLYSGIVIPWINGGNYWKVNIRRRPSQLKPNEQRYMQAKGGGNGLYRASQVAPGCTVVITEGEFDALCICAALESSKLDSVVPVATGSTGGSRLLNWVATLAKSDRMLVAFDADDAGDNASRWWQDVFDDKAARLRPTRHDVTDMFKAGDDIVAWISDALSSP
ncbi:MAG: toprim domain-containing protein [Chloroflexi bacterium]|nr:toprim domain-containing protein [Chloroflexota bacterium]